MLKNCGRLQICSLQIFPARKKSRTQTSLLGKISTAGDFCPNMATQRHLENLSKKTEIRCITSILKVKTEWELHIYLCLREKRNKKQYWWVLTIIEELELWETTNLWSPQIFPARMKSHTQWKWSHALSENKVTHSGFPFGKNFHCSGFLSQYSNPKKWHKSLSMTATVRIWASFLGKISTAVDFCPNMVIQKSGTSL